jgi:hypothetical protein
MARRSARLRPPTDPSISRFGRHHRCWAACLPGTRRRTRPFGFGRREARRRPHRQKRPARSCRYVAAGGVRSACRIRGRQRRERLRHDLAMRWIVGGKAAHGCAASPSQMGRFETRWLTAAKNLSALADLSGRWIDKVHRRRPPRGVVLDMDSSVSPTHGEQS